MFQLGELARITKAERERSIAEAIRVRRLLRDDDDTTGRSQSDVAPPARNVVPGSVRSAAGSSRP